MFFRYLAVAAKNFILLSDQLSDYIWCHFVSLLFSLSGDTGNRARFFAVAT